MNSRLILGMCFRFVESALPTIFFLNDTLFPISKPQISEKILFIKQKLVNIVSKEVLGLINNGKTSKAVRM